jgi:hypothetical protein
MPDGPFAQSFCKGLGAIDVGVCRIQSRRKQVFSESPARPVHDENRETPALAFGAHGDDLLLAGQAPFSPKGSPFDKASLGMSFGNVDEKMTDLTHDSVLVWAIEVSLAGASQTWHYGFHQRSVSFEATCCLQISLSCKYPRFAIEIDSILSHYDWTLTQIGMVATHDEVTQSCCDLDK